MAIQHRPFPNRFAILPSDGYHFGPPTFDRQRVEVVAQAALPSGVSVLAVNVGLLAFDFTDDKHLGKFTVLDSSNDGLIPESVMENREAMLRLQGARLKVATFATACILGVHAFKTHSAVESALFPGLDEVYSWADTPGVGFSMFSADAVRLINRLDRRSEPPTCIPASHVAEGLDLATRLVTAGPGYHSVDPVSMIVMTYQAMILHNRQHAGASIALQALVAEAALKEMLYAFGLVDGVPARLAARSRAIPDLISKKKARSLGFDETRRFLTNAGLLDRYLSTRIDGLRQARNALMHEVQDGAPKQSGDGLTAVRDVLRLCTGERCFELIMRWAYRF